MDTKSGKFFYPDDVTRSSPVPYHEFFKFLYGSCSVTSVSLRSPKSESGHVSDTRGGANSI